MRLILLTCAAAGMACLCGCAAPAGKAGAPAKAPAPKAAGEVLAKVGDTLITDLTLDEEIKAMPPRIVGRYQSSAGRKNLLNQMVEMELIYREAASQGLDKDKEAVERIEKFRKRLAAEKLREKVLDAVKVDKDEIRKEYEKEGVRYKTPKQVKVSQIVFTWDKAAEPKTVEAVKKDAAGVLERAKKGEDFAELAKKYSLDQASASKGGDIGYATRRALSDEAYKVAMAIEKTGEISGLVEGKDEVRILKATEVVPEKKKPLEEVSPWIERSVQSRKQREAWLSYVEELKKKEGVEIYEEKIGGEEKGGAADEPKAPAGMGDPGIQAPMQIRLGPGQLNAPAAEGQKQPQGAPREIRINMGDMKKNPGASGWTQPQGAPVRVAPPAAPPAAKK